MHDSTIGGYIRFLDHIEEFDSADKAKEEEGKEIRVRARPRSSIEAGEEYTLTHKAAVQVRIRAVSKELREKLIHQNTRKRNTEPEHSVRIPLPESRNIVLYRIASVDVDRDIRSQLILTQVNFIPMPDRPRVSMLDSFVPFQPIPDTISLPTWDERCFTVVQRTPYEIFESIGRGSNASQASTMADSTIGRIVEDIRGMTMRAGIDFDTRELESRILHALRAFLSNYYRVPF